VKKWIEEIIFLKPLEKEAFSGLEKVQNLSINILFGIISGTLENLTIKTLFIAFFATNIFL